MTVETKTFRDYYSNLIKHPEKVKKEEMLDTIEQTFRAFSRNDSVEFNGQRTAFSKLKAKDIEVFRQFAKVFLSNTEVSEEQAEKMQAHLTQIRANNPNDLRWYALENQLYLHEKFEPITDAKDPKADAEMRILAPLQAKQKETLQLEQKAKKEKHQAFIKGIVGGAMVLGGLVALAGLGALAAFNPLFILLAIGVCAALAGGGGVLMQQAHLDQRKAMMTFGASMQELKKLENYHRYIKQPMFQDFLLDPANGYEKIKDNPNHFYKFLDLYALQKQYGESLHHIEIRLEALDRTKRVATAMEMADAQPLIDNLNQQFAQINSQRAELGLEPLPRPNI